jgi:hypothetical protein
VKLQGTEEDVHLIDLARSLLPTTSYGIFSLKSSLKKLLNIAFIIIEAWVKAVLHPLGYVAMVELSNPET